MSVKSVLKKIGKVALTAAPYVAAPFTGGASLMATGLANKAVQKWSEHDAKDAIAHGLAPSKFDSVLGKIGTVSSLASSFIPTNALGSIGMLGSAGKAASTAAKTGSVLSKAADAGSKVAKGVSIANKVKKVADVAIPAIGAAAAIKGMSGSGGGSSAPATTGIGPSSNPNVNGPITGQYTPYQPQADSAVNRGRLAGAKDQGFRRGYDVTTRIGLPDDEGNYKTQVSRMPRINTDYASMGIQKKRKSAINEDGTMKPLPIGSRRIAAGY